MPSAQDPFYVVKEEIQESVSLLTKFLNCFCSFLIQAYFKYFRKYLHFKPYNSGV